MTGHKPWSEIPMKRRATDKPDVPVDEVVADPLPTLQVDPDNLLPLSDADDPVSTAFHHGTDVGYRLGHLAGCDETEARLGPLPVTVDDEHASPVTGWVMRLPEEMGGGCVVAPPDFGYVDAEGGRRMMSASEVKDLAVAHQMDARDFFEVMFDAGNGYAEARWWSEALRVVLAAERGEQ